MTDWTIELGSVADWRRDGEQLFVEHYREVAKHRNVLTLAPDWTKYEQFERHGDLIVLLARDATTRQLVGYSVVILTPLLHYKRQVAAMNDVLFVTESRRRGGRAPGETSICRALMDASESHAKQAGADLITWHAKEGTALDIILRRRADYIVQDIIYSKVL